jgi:hypothetical protein
MTRHTDPARAALALVVLALVCAASTTVAAQGDQPTVSVENATVAADGTATVDVVLTSAPNGLAGYLLELSVEGDAARIESVSYAEQFGVTTEPSIGAEDRTATLEAADLEGNVQAGATDVTLATVAIVGAGAGEATLAVEPVQFDADGGAAFEPASRSGTLTVEAGVTPSDDASTPTPDAGDKSSASGAGNPTSGAGDPTTGDGPLSPVLALIALAVLTAAALTRGPR